MARPPNKSNRAERQCTRCGPGPLQSVARESVSAAAPLKIRWQDQMSHHACGKQDRTPCGSRWAHARRFDCFGPIGELVCRRHCTPCPASRQKPRVVVVAPDELDRPLMVTDLRGTRLRSCATLLSIDRGKAARRWAAPPRRPRRSAPVLARQTRREKGECNDAHPLAGALAGLVGDVAQEEGPLPRVPRGAASSWGRPRPRSPWRWVHCPPAPRRRGSSSSVPGSRARAAAGVVRRRGGGPRGGQPRRPRLDHLEPAPAGTGRTLRPSDASGPRSMAQMFDSTRYLTAIKPS